MNADDICAEIAAARGYITRGDYTAALDALDQAIKVWSAERDYWAWVELEAVRGVSRDERARIADAQPAVTWVPVSRDWLGNVDHYESDQT